MQELKKRVQEFVVSEDGQRLGAKYNKFAVDFRKSITKDKNGDIVIENEKIEDIYHDFEDLNDEISKL